MLTVTSRVGSMVYANVAFYTRAEYDQLPAFTVPTIVLDTKAEFVYNRDTMNRVHAAYADRATSGVSLVAYPSATLHSNGRFFAIVSKQQSAINTPVTMIIQDNQVIDMDIEIYKHNGYSVLCIPLGLIIPSEKLADAKQLQKHMEAYATTLLDGVQVDSLTIKQFFDKYAQMFTVEAKKFLSEKPDKIEKPKKTEQLDQLFTIKLKGRHSSSPGFALVVDRNTGYVLCKTNKPANFIKDVKNELVFVEERIDVVPHKTEKLRMNYTTQEVTTELMYDRSYNGMVGVYKIAGFMTVRCQNKLKLDMISEYDPAIACYEYYGDEEDLYSIDTPKRAGLHKSS